MDEINWGNGVKVPMIKLVRQLTGLGLKEAKELVEQYPTSSETEAPVTWARNFRNRLEDLEVVSAQRSVPEKELSKQTTELEKKNSSLSYELSQTKVIVENLRDRLKESEDTVTSLLRDINGMQQDDSWKPEVRRAIYALVEHETTRVVDILVDLLADQKKSSNHSCYNCLHAPAEDKSEWPCCDCDNFDRWEEDK
jgi:DNA-binding transcriptional MerR regulator